MKSAEGQDVAVGLHQPADLRQPGHVELEELVLAEPVPGLLHRYVGAEGPAQALIHRIKDGREYYVLPGGGIKDETPEEAAVREVKEETNFDIVIDKFLYEFEDEFHHGYYFLAKNFTGELKLGGPELKKNCEYDQYSLIWMSLDKLPTINLFPENFRQEILDSLNKIFK